ncbi:helix-turn-helix domain-containing protein [Gemmatimonas sp.]|uniref:helix-turn-helix domain-containing protein n=1 Tax=Gemmatimonas sp. TaxID=1962908 RepID=UPI003DA23D41
MSATNRDPQESVQQGLLREDLFYRLARGTHQAAAAAQASSKTFRCSPSFSSSVRGNGTARAGAPAPTFEPETMAFLQSRPWRGNVRELQNVIEHLAVIVDGGRNITPDDIPVYDDAVAEQAAQTGLPAGIMNEAFHLAKDNLIAHFEKEYLARLTMRAGGNMSKAARLAGIDRTTLYRLMEKHGFKRDVLSGVAD